MWENWPTDPSCRRDLSPYPLSTTPSSVRSPIRTLSSATTGLPGRFRTRERGDIVVFNFPHGDTVLSKRSVDDYYTHVRFNGREYTERMYGPLITRPVDKEDNYVKRCVAVAGDTLRCATDGYLSTVTHWMYILVSRIPIR